MTFPLQITVTRRKVLLINLFSPSDQNNTCVDSVDQEETARSKPSH